MHLHVAFGYSTRYGPSHPGALVRRACGAWSGLP